MALALFLPSEIRADRVPLGTWARRNVMRVVAKFQKTLLGAAAAVALTCGFGATSAYAVPTATVDGITFPIDSAPGGAVFSDQVDLDVLITTVGQSFNGIGLLGTIRDVPTVTTTYIQPCLPTGCLGTFLADVFDGFTVRAITFNGTTGFDIYMTGGSLRYYVLPARPNQNTGSQATDITNSTSATLFLNLAPAVFDAFGDTFHVFVPGASLSTFSGNAQGDAFLNVIGGDAAPYFDSNTFCVGVSPACAFGFADLQFVGNAHLVTSGADFPVSGTDDLFSNTVGIPEPGTLVLLGAGLIGLGAMRRRRKARA